MLHLQIKEKVIRKRGFPILIACLLLMLAACKGEEKGAVTALVSNSPYINAPNVIDTPTLSATVTKKSSSPNASQTYTATLANEDMQLKWLKGNPCRLPCWEQITPKKTGIIAALSVLNHNPDIQVTNSGSPEEPHRIEWNWTSSSKKGGTIYYDLQSSIIQQINMVFSKNFSLKDVIQTYGEPDFVIATETWVNREGTIIEHTLSFVYETYGFTLYDASTGKPPTLNNDNSFANVVIFNPKSTLTEQNVMGNPTYLVAWQGFKDFAFYCRTTNAFGVIPCPAH